MSKRRWLQFHLSTAVVLMFVVGGLLWLNMVQGPGSMGLALIRHDFLGWPLPYCTDDWQEMSESRNIVFFIVDAAIAYATLLGVAFLLEWRIRRKTAKP